MKEGHQRDGCQRLEAPPHDLIRLREPLTLIEPVCLRHVKDWLAYTVAVWAGLFAKILIVGLS